MPLGVSAGRRKVVVGLAVISCGSAGAGVIEPIGATATGVSADGSVVAGYVSVNDEFEMYRWTSDEGLATLGRGVAFDISRDGSVLVGSRFNGLVNRAVRWSASTGIVELGQLPGVGPAGTLFTEGYDVSADGSVVVGLADASTAAGPPFRGFRWTSATGMTALGDIPGGAVFSQASAISADGQTIVGFSEGPSGQRAVRWLAGNATPVSMGLPPDRLGFTEARHVSGDGNVVVGVWGNGAENEAFRWTASTGYELLGDLPGGIVDSFANATNADGSVIVGSGNPGDTLPDEPFYWTPSHGMRTLRDVLIANQIDFSQWDQFVELRDLSDDGLTMVGTGVLKDGSFAGFRVVLPEPASLAAFAASAGLLLSRRPR